jgi:CCR4-NOT transcription complex subunit 4
MAHDQGDSFISDDEEELCPLCVEEMDLSDKNFKPCPCGYQVCQFCYNNIRQNPQLNGKCPACRRPYTDDNVEYRMVSQEEWKQDHLRQARKERERKQREREKKETESQQGSKKHLSGMRVIQKNLVYVIGLNPNIPTEELHHTLRGDQFFGQYGKIQKIVINRRNNANGVPGLGVYVTFARKDDASRCIAAVDGSINDGKYLRAAYGTTKYCSSYLRGLPCPNPNCMFLHEPGEEADSYTRQDLSTIQHAARQGLQRPASRATKTAEEETTVTPDTPPALPATVSWAHKPSPPSVAQKLDTPGTATPNGKPAPPTDTLPPGLVPQPEPPAMDPTVKLINESLETLSQGSFRFVFSSNMLNESDMNGSLAPYFSFSKTSAKNAAIKTDRFTDLFASFNRTGRLRASRPTEGSTDQPTLDDDIVNDGAKSTTTPPPGLFSGASQNNGLNTLAPQAMVPPLMNQNSQELLARLMNGTTRGEQW